jgi:hypothetical protein
VAIVEEDAPVSGGVIAVNAPGSQADIPAQPAAIPVPPPAQPISGASSDRAPGPGVPIDAILVEAVFRTSPSAIAEQWPFTDTRMRDVFGTPGPNQRVVRVVDDAFEADTYRRLGRPHGLEPGGPPVFIIVGDGFDQYDLLIQEGE